MSFPTLKLFTLGVILSSLTACSSIYDVYPTEYIVAKQQLVKGGSYNLDAPSLGEAERLAVKHRLLPNELVNDKEYFIKRYAINLSLEKEFKAKMEAQKNAIDYELIVDLLTINSGGTNATLIKNWGDKDEFGYIEHNGVKVVELISPIFGHHTFFNDRSNCDANCMNKSVNKVLGETYIQFMNAQFGDRIEFNKETTFGNSMFVVHFRDSAIKKQIFVTNSSMASSDGNFTTVDGERRYTSFPQYQIGKTLINDDMRAYIYRKNDQILFNAMYIQNVQPTLEKGDVVYIPIQEYYSSGFETRSCIGGIFITDTNLHPLEATQCDNTQLYTAISKEYK